MSRQFGIVVFISLLLPAQISVADDKQLDGDLLFAHDQLVDVQISLVDSDWNDLRQQTRDMGAMFSGATSESPYTYFKANISIDGTMIESVGIRKKGFFGSQDNNRPSLKVKFDEFVKQDPIKGLSRLTLNNNKQDKTQLSQFLTYNLFRKAGIHAPRSNLAKVTINGQYLGIYSNVESIKKAFLARTFGDKSGNLYEGTLTDFHPKTVEKLEVKTNEKANDRSDITRLAKLLAADGELDMDELGRVINVEQFLRFWALEGMTKFWDGYTANQNNYFLYMNPNDGLGYFIPWGADWVLSHGSPFGNARGNTAIYAQSILANRMYGAEGVPERYRTTMLALLDEVWNEDELLSDIDRLEKLVAPHLHESQHETPQATQDLRHFIRSRRSDLVAALNDWPATIPDEPRKPMYTVPVGESTGAFAAKWTRQPPRDGSSVGTADIKLKLDGEDVAFHRMGVTAFTFQFPGFGGRSSGGRAAPPAPVNINFTGIRRSDGERITLSLSVSKEKFQARNVEAIGVTGRLTVGQPRGFGGFGGGGRSINGTLLLTKSGMEDGDEVAGTVDLKIVETHGGIFNQREPPRGRGEALGTMPQPPSGPPSRSSGSPQAPSLLKILDANQDGKLSKGEIDRAAVVLRRFDLNRDGEVTALELMAQPKPDESPDVAKTFTTQDDHRNMMKQLGITKLRPGPSGNPQADNAANYDETLANPYPDWPEVLKLANGESVETAEVWRKQRRPEIVQLFEREVYGKIPNGVPEVTWAVKESRVAKAGEVSVVEQHIIGTVDSSDHKEIDVQISMSLTLPKETNGPIPVLMMFGRTPFDPMPEWMRRFRQRGDGGAAGRPAGPRPLSPQDELLAAGWGVAMINPSSIQADNGEGLTKGIIGLTNLGKPRKPDQWGSLRAWGWGASRGLDYLQTRAEVHREQVGIEGVSRYGKAALVTMAFDERFAMVLVGSSGAGGATPHRRNFGEAVENLAGSGEYHWMAGNFLKYAAEESSFGKKTSNDLPVDSHQLIALCAPRLTFISYGIPEKGDANWLDQRGSFMATVAAGPVFELLGAGSLSVTENFRTAAMPAVNEDLLDGELAWRQHDGGHTDAPNIKHFIQWAESNFQK